MAAIGIELCNAGFQAAVCAKDEPTLLAPGERDGMLDWPGFAYVDGQKLRFGREAEDAWFVHPRQVSHVFWEKLSHDASPLVVGGRTPSFSELAYHFLRDFVERVTGASGPPEKVVLAIPGSY